MAWTREVTGTVGRGGQIHVGMKELVEGLNVGSERETAAM